MTPSFMTILAEIRDGVENDLRSLLELKLRPIYNSKTDRIRSTRAFPLDKVAGLHFFGAVILPRDGDIPPMLVFEATFDGDRDQFITTLFHACPAAIDAIFTHCVGYPPTGMALPSAVRDFLVAHDGGAQTMYRGSPGRTVAQIKLEDGVRSSAQTFLTKLSRRRNAPTSYAEVQHALETQYLASARGPSWIDQKAAMPWEVKYGTAFLALVLASIFVALVFIASGIIDSALGWLAGWVNVPPSVPDGIRWLYAKSNEVCSLDKASSHPICYYPALWLSHLNLPINGAIALPIFFSLFLRFIQRGLLERRSNPFAQTVTNSGAVHLITVLRWLLISLIVGFATLSIFNQWADPKISCPDVIKSSIALNADTCQHPPTAPHVSAWWTVVASFLVSLAAWAVWFFRQTVKLKLDHDERLDVFNRARFVTYDLLRLVLIVLVVVDTLTLARIVPATYLELIGPWVTACAMLFLSFAVRAAVLAVLLAVVWVVLLLYAHLREKYEQQSGRYRPASELLANPSSNAHAYAGEEIGPNRLQNYLVSVTNVRPGRFRYACVRVVLFAVNVLARFHYNKGELGGIPTIFSARWLLINEGRRVIFLDHYGGHWDSYLNEFIDMSAVLGVNAIWTNTYVRSRLHSRDDQACSPNAESARACPGSLDFIFPRTQSYFWGGAQDEKPFKAYVRESQIAPSIWWSAYPKLDITSVNLSTAVRNTLFAQRQSSTVEDLLQHY